jgi:hypothetical protein
MANDINDPYTDLLFPIRENDYVSDNTSVYAVTSTPVQATTRRLNTRYTLDLQQDIRAMHNIDIENELTSMINEDVVKDIREAAHKKEIEELQYEIKRLREEIEYLRGRRIKVKKKG